jgi:hypothetical protein
MANSKFIQGIYTPENPSKYIGKGSICYRSSYELKLFRWLDTNQKVKFWSSETLKIPYLYNVDNKVHTYYPDCLVIFEENGNHVKYLLEVKPKRETLPPVKTERKKKKTILFEQLTYQKNICKWAAARDFCEKNNMKFILITEEHLNLVKN